MIRPANGHLLIEPIVRDSFIASSTDKYQEIGFVKGVSQDLCIDGMAQFPVSIGDKIYFDSWLAAKFPGEKDGEYYWLVKWEDVRAIEHAEPK